MPKPIIFEAHESYVLKVLFTGDSQTLLSAGMDNHVKMWSVPDWTLIQDLPAHLNSVNGMALSPDERILATCSSDKTVKQWSFPNLELLHTMQDRKKVVAAVTFSADGAWVAGGSYGGRVTVWNTAGELVVGIPASKKNTATVALSPDSKTLAAAGLGDDISLWALPSGEPIGKLTGHEIAVISLHFIHGGRTLASLGYEQKLRLWDTETWQEQKVLDPHTVSARGIAYSPDEKRIALSLKGRVQVWSLKEWEIETELLVGTNAVNGAAFSPDGRWIAVGAADHKIRVWEA